MLTECPSCLTVFRVTGAILKMGHGQVRCGKCRTQFDALDSLLDDSEEANDAAKSTASSTPGPIQPQEEPPIEAQQPDIAEEITLEGSRIEISGTYRVAGIEAQANSDATQERFVHEHVVIDRDEPSVETADDNAQFDTPDEEQFIEIDVDDGEPVAEAANHLLSDTIPPITEQSVPFSQRIWKRAGVQKDSQRNAAKRQIAAELDALTYSPSPPAKRSRLWMSATVVLLIALIVQVLHHYRDPLVRSPKFGSTIAGVYRALGFTLTPNWDLRAYKLQYWGMIPAGSKSDELRLKANVTNEASFTQPYPFIKLTMKDRWEMPVAVRTFAPNEYLPAPESADRMMAPKQRATADILFVDPGSDAVGYTIDPCLPHNANFVCEDELPPPTKQ